MTTAQYVLGVDGRIGSPKKLVQIYSRQKNFLAANQGKTFVHNRQLVALQVFQGTRAQAFRVQTSEPSVTCNTWIALYIFHGWIFADTRAQILSSLDFLSSVLSLRQVVGGSGTRTNNLSSRKPR